jgi:hypothetical protein|nr:hypothetical protein [Kofleriaceae bacterium]
MPHTLRWLALLAPVALAPVAACSSSSSSQVITGRVAPGFPAQVTQVRALANGDVIARATVAADGSFSIAIPPQAGVALDVVGTSPTRVVFPRHAGTIDSTFAIRGGGGAYDLGEIRFVGSSDHVSFAFHDGDGSGSGACDDDGKDGSGDTCVDDGDHGTGSACDGDGNRSPGGPGSDDRAGDGDGSDNGDAVCDHNFPSDGCSDDGDGHHGSDDGSDDDGSDDGSGDGSGHGSDT